MMQIAVTARLSRWRMADEPERERDGADEPT